MGNGLSSLAIPKLLPRIIMIDKNCAVIGYASGKNKHSFMQLVDNGMFAMTKIDGDDALIVDGNCVRGGHANFKGG